jgi:hypothetical protein
MDSTISESGEIKWSRYVPTCLLTKQADPLIFRSQKLDHMKVLGKLETARLRSEYSIGGRDSFCLRRQADLDAISGTRNTWSPPFLVQV